MKTELTWRDWLMSSKNQALLKESPSRAKRQFLTEQDVYRRKWDYLQTMWLSSTSLTTIEQEVEVDSDAIGSYGIGVMVVYGGQAIYNDDDNNEELIETSPNEFQPVFVVR